MILALDIGNTNITIGCYKGKELLFISRMATDRSRMEDQYAIELRDILDINGVRTLKSTVLDFSVMAVYVWDNINVIKNRLEDRYRAVAGGEEKLRSRLNENSGDFLNMPENSKYFDAFVKNETPGKTAEHVICASVCIS